MQERGPLALPSCHFLLEGSSFFFNEIEMLSVVESTSKHNHSFFNIFLIYWTLVSTRLRNMFVKQIISPSRVKIEKSLKPPPKQRHHHHDHHNYPWAFPATIEQPEMLHPNVKQTSRPTNRSLSSLGGTEENTTEMTSWKHLLLLSQKDHEMNI